MAPLGIWLEMEVGITGGEEDGVDNTGVDNASLYTQPADVGDVYKALDPTAPTSVLRLRLETVIKSNPELVIRCLIFHGGSGSTEQEIKEAFSDGVVKMNIDTLLTPNTCTVVHAFCPRAGYTLRNKLLPEYDVGLDGSRGCRMHIGRVTP
ncbi:hypothetical protein M378DRAFT_18681 [Amanita muscaria Koide BX008]|uniref:Fructose-bisphosphate aldolase n=1 Tax=Amanita muscaria (strain Koide BX008) TaxID=946122 RepID=A0A0C2W0M9_AMAMK|nr:hypothetical protein M378DRAFT_18681 [Amanita muscaria Koide BX008]